MDLQCTNRKVMEKILKDKVAVITGAAQGVGAVTAKLFAQEGASVILTDINYPFVFETANNLAKQGYKAVAKRLNVADSPNAKAVVEEICNIFGTIHIWVNNAGITEKSDISHISERSWDKMLDINLKGTFFYTQAVFDIMKKQNYGKLIHLSSLAGLCGSLTSSASYAIAKAGILNLSKCFAKAGAKYGITSNCICPGHISTKMAETLNFDDKVKERIPMGRLGTPTDVAGAILFYASELSDYITGTHLNVNGGEYF